MSKSTCTFPECNRPYKCKGLCSSHYSQQFKGRPLTPIKDVGTEEDRFWSKVEKSKGCWNWTAGKDTGGYGTIRFRGRVQKAHRASLTIAGIEVQPGMDVDHICHNRACVNPGHLRTATRKQNIENLAGAHKDNPTGARGVSWNEARQKYMARVGHHNVRLYLGLFDSIEEANAAVVAKRNELYTHNDADRVTNS